MDVIGVLYVNVVYVIGQMEKKEAKRKKIFGVEGRRVSEWEWGAKKKKEVMEVFQLGITKG